MYRKSFRIKRLEAKRKRCVEMRAAKHGRSGGFCGASRRWFMQKYPLTGQQQCRTIKIMKRKPANPIGRCLTIRFDAPTLANVLRDANLGREGKAMVGRAYL